MRKTIGIIGGMGPLATCDLFRKIVEAENVPTDQDHVRVLIDSNTTIPDRTAAILQGGASPVPAMTQSALLLARMGARVLIMPCNTAHYFYGDIAEQLHGQGYTVQQTKDGNGSENADQEILFLNMLEETARTAKAQGITTAGLLATDGTIRSGVYAEAFAKQGISLLTPKEQGQQDVMSLIYDGVKAGKRTFDPKPFLETVDDLMQRGAQVLILGCTELPVAKEWYGFSFPHLDPTLILAESAVRAAGKGRF